MARHAERSTSRSEEHTSELQSHSDLHSFPTRRSSDLRWWWGTVGRTDTAAVVLSQQPATAATRERLRHVLKNEAIVELAGPDLPLAMDLAVTWNGWRGTLNAALRDRKSTRLNSSHTVIYTLSLHDALPISDGGGEPSAARTQPRSSSPSSLRPPRRESGCAMSSRMKRSWNSQVRIYRWPWTSRLPGTDGEAR